MTRRRLEDLLHVDGRGVVRLIFSLLRRLFMRPIVSLVASETIQNRRIDAMAYDP